MLRGAAAACSAGDGRRTCPQKHLTGRLLGAGAHTAMPTGAHPQSGPTLRRPQAHGQLLLQKNLKGTEFVSKIRKERTSYRTTVFWKSLLKQRLWKLCFEKHESR